MVYIRLGLIPNYPTVKADFPALIDNENLDFKVYDVNVQDLDGGTQDLVSGSIIWFSDLGNKSVSEVVIPLDITLDAPIEEYETIDVRVVVRRAGDLIVDEIISYNFEEETSPPSKPGGYIVIPPIGPNIQAIFRKDGLPPLCMDLEAAVQAVLDAEVPPAGTLNIAELTLDQCRHVALELVWGNNKQDVPRPDKKLWKLYTLDNPTDDLDPGREEARQKFEASLQSYYSKPNAEAENLTKYIWSLVCALVCEKKTEEADTITFRFPLRPDETDINKVNELAVKLKAVDNAGNPSIFGDLTKVSKEYLYALGVELPIQIGADQRLVSAIRSETSLLLQQFESAKKNDIISINVDKDQDETPISYTADTILNKHEAIRKLHLLDDNLRNIPVCEVNVATPDQIAILIDYWTTFPLEDINSLWSNIASLSTAAYDGKEAHSDLVICAITLGQAQLTTVLDGAASEVGDLEGATKTDWQGWFIAAETIAGGEILLPFIPSGLTQLERAEIFCIYAQNFFNISASGSAFGGINTQGPPVFGVSGPIEDYIAAHGFDSSQAATFAAAVFDDDLCAQEWFIKKIEQFIFLYNLTKDLLDVIGDPISGATQMAIMEGIFSKGFVSPESVIECSQSEFTEGLTGTTAFAFADQLYGFANSLILRKLIFENCIIITDPFDPILEDIIQGLNNNGIFTVEDLAKFEIDDLRTILTTIDPALDSCTESILTAAIQATGATIDDQFIPVNPNGTLVNCIAPEHQSVFGKPSYLSDLLQLSKSSTCDNIIISGASDLLIEIIKERRGNLNLLEVTETNTNTCLPYIDIVNESLEALVEDPTGAGAVYNTPIFESRGHQLQIGESKNGNRYLTLKELFEKNCPPVLTIPTLWSDIEKAFRDREIVYIWDIHKYHPEDFKNILIDINPILEACALEVYLAAIESASENTHRHNPEDFFGAVPAHFSSAASDILHGDFSAPGLPYNNQLDILNTYLACLGTNRFEIQKKFRKEVHEFPLNPDLDEFDPSPTIPFRNHLSRYPVSYPLALEYLGFTQKEADFLFSNATLPIANAIELYGFPNPDIEGIPWFNIAQNLREFLKRTGLEYCDFYHLSKAIEDWSYVSFSIVNKTGAAFVELSECAPCTYDNLELKFNTLNSQNGLIRIILFIRLWQKLNNCFSFYQLRDVCEELELFQSGQINSNLVRKLAAFKMLHKIFALPLNNGSVNSGQVGTYRTHILALWKDIGWALASEENKALWDWSLSVFLEKVEDYAVKTYQCEYQGADCRELLESNLNQLSELVGFDLAPSNKTWNNCPHLTIRFADFIAKFFASGFTYGEFMWIFANQHIRGDDPFLLQSRSEAVCFPLDFPDNEPDFSLEALREKLCEIAVGEEELETWNWQRIENDFQQNFCLEENSNPLIEIAKRFFPEKFAAAGNQISAIDQQFRVAVTTNSALWKTQDPEGPFQYDVNSNELWYALPINTDLVFHTLSRVRQLNDTSGDSEQQAIKDLIYLPYDLLSRVSFVFSDFSKIKEKLIEEGNEDLRFEYFKNEYVKFRKKTDCIIQFIAQFTESITCIKNEEGNAVIQSIIKGLYSDENFAVPPSSWENKDGNIPTVTWSPLPNGGALSALLGVQGHGILNEYYDLDDNLVWRDINQTTDFFGEIENKWNAPVPGFIPSIGYSNQFGAAIVRNGFGTQSSNAEGIGGAEGFKIKSEGVVWINEGGKYHFMAGKPTESEVPPMFSKDMIEGWSVSLKKEQKEWQLLSYNKNQPDIPPHQTEAIKLKRGAYLLCIEYIQPHPNLDDENKVCPQTTGFQLKYKGADTAGNLISIPLKNLFIEKKEKTLADGLNIEGVPLQYLQNYYYTTIHDSRNVFNRIVKAGVFAYRFGLSAQGIADDGSSELDFLQKNSDCFRGYSYNWNGTHFIEHEVKLDFNLFPVQENYCPPDTSNDPRNYPSIARKRAFADLWETMFDYTQIKCKSKNAPEPPSWLAVKEILENHPDSKVHLLRHLGIDLNLLDKTLRFYPNFEIKDDIKQIGWLNRICQSALYLEKMACNFSFWDYEEIFPDLWAADENDLLPGVENLSKAIRFGLIEGGVPRLYKLLEQINNEIRVRYRNAMIDFLTGMDRMKFPNSDDPVKSATDLSQYLLMDVKAGVCQKLSRIEEGINAIQIFLQQAKLGLEYDFSPSDPFSHLYEKVIGSYQTWKECKKRKHYEENLIEFEKLTEVRKSETFGFLEQELKQRTLTIPESGGTTVLDTSKPMAHMPLQLLQKVETSIIAKTPNQTEGFDLLGSPEKYSQSWLSSTQSDETPFWIQAAHRLEMPFVRLAASGLPLAGIGHDCSHDNCCKVCGEIHPPLVDEYYFGLMDSRQYDKIDQDATWYDDPANEIEELQYLEPKPTVFLIWTRIHNGKIQPLGRSSKGIEVTNLNNLGLDYSGRVGDSLEFKVNTALNPDDTFWFHLVNDTVDVLPCVGQTEAVANGPGGLSSNPYFIYFESGAPLQPKSNFNAILAITSNLKNHCRFDAALKWYELEIRPLKENNTWINDTAIEDISCRRSLLLNYVETLIQWGQHLMKKNSGESLQKAGLIFRTAKKILGDCPKTIQLKDDLDNIQNMDHFTPQPPPLNPRLMCIYEQVEEHCNLIHECINIWRQNSHSNKLPYEGNSNFHCSSDVDSCLQELLWCIPDSPYRFVALQAKAVEYINVASGMGNSLLSVLEKADAEALNILRETHSNQITNLTQSIKENAALESHWNRQATEKRLELAMNRLAYHQNLIANGLISEENDYLNFTDQSMISAAIAQSINAILGPIEIVPDPYIGPFPLLHSPGGQKIAKSIGTGAKVANIIASIQGTRAGKRATQGSWARRLQEWQQRVEELKIEIQELKRQLLANQLREQITLKEAKIHQLQIKQSKEILDFIKEKFTNQELYLWLVNETSSLYHQMMDCARQVALQAQIAYNFECGFTNRNFLDFEPGDSLYHNLLMGDKLRLALMNMEKSFWDKNIRELEISKQISFAKYFPHALFKLKKTGKCIIEIPEHLFDWDYPGHYERRIASITLTIPCVVGPYTSVNCRLTLLSSKTRIDPSLGCPTEGCCEEVGSKSPYRARPNDNRFVHRFHANQSIATSSGQNDSGMFELNFKEERYLHFQCQGAISSWCLEMPQEDNYFDLNSVTDVIMTMNYIACEGGQLLAQEARKEAQNHLPGNGLKLFDVANEMPNQWYEFQTSFEKNADRELLIQLRRNAFPFIPGKHELMVNQLEIFFETCEELECRKYEIQLLLNPKDRDQHPDKCDLLHISCIQRGDFGCLYHGLVNFKPIAVSSKQPIDLGILIFPEEIQCINDLYLMVDYGIERKSNQCK